ncbi:hypothetical protein [Aestuariicoccus sp. MJ-SS9]|uniref:hypothetical protein n=1 Tax=Aestuariicoccus sp. MJ-SS9 TaxID=3079855 RepID=UPI0029143CD1|nr:hypothetical protein [Aestuariicoccus sp. MJ-SS9]MDU8911280.1 hypothetical protein [Aestuariicoccus sp. MJ-SS9]
MKTHITHRNFTMAHAAVLAALIGAACLLSPLNGGTHYPVAQAADTPEHGAVDTGHTAIVVRTAGAKDGVVWFFGARIKAQCDTAADQPTAL